MRPFATRLASFVLLLAVGLTSTSSFAAPRDADVEGRVTAVAESSFEVDGTTVAVSDSTAFEHENGATLAFSDLAVGLHVEVEVTDAGAGTLVAHLVRVSDNASDGDEDDSDKDDSDEEDEEREEVEVKGLVDARSASSLTVSGITFAVDASTTIETSGQDAGDALLALLDIALGTAVEVEGYADSTGGLIAVSIEVEEADDEDREVEAEGPITELSAASLTVDGVTFALAAETEVEGDRDADLTTADLALGLIVEVEGRVGAEGPVADQIKIEYDARDDEDDDDEEERADEVEVTGAVEAVADSSLTVAGLTFAVTAETDIRGLDDEALTLADLAVGLAVEVEGRTDSTGTFVALEVKREDGLSLNGAVSVTAAIDLVQQGRLVILGRVFEVRPPTEFVDASGASSELDAFATGDVVTVRARLAGNGRRLTALRVEAAAAAADVVSLRGPLFESGDGYVEVAGVPFAVDGATTFVGADGTPTTAATLTAGQAVEVDASVLADGSRLATSVRLAVAVQTEGTVSADDASAGDGSTSRLAASGAFTLGGVRVTYDQETLFRDVYDRPVDRSAIGAGARVRVVGEAAVAAAAGRTSGSPSVTADQVVFYDASAEATAAVPAPAPAEPFTVRAYPNPTAGRVRLAFDVAPGVSVAASVYDVLGREVVSVVRTVIVGEVAFDLTGLPAGAYVYRVEVGADGGARVSTGQITVVR